MNYNDHQGNSNWEPSTPGNPVFQQKLPNSGGAFVLGIVSLCITVICCFCYGSFVGIITSIIGLVLGAKATSLYQTNPSAYTEKSFKQAKAGKIMNLIALILALIISLLLVVVIIMGLNHDLPPDMQNSFDESMNKYQRRY